MSFSAQIVADSKNEFGNRITTFVVTFPRIILAEFNTHRMLSKNSASSRAIPYKKALKSVIENPFIPIGFMKDHSGMQGKEFLDMDRVYSWNEIYPVLLDLIEGNFKNEDGTWDEDYSSVDNILNTNVLPLLTHKESRGCTIKEWWLLIRDLVVSASLILVAFGVTKQIANRLLEPFMWHTVITTGTEWDNFFGLRVHEAAEIHMQKIASMMLEEYNKSTPKLLKAGEWHIPYEEKMKDVERDIEIITKHTGKFGSVTYDRYVKQEIDEVKVKIGTVMAARTSYTVVGSDQRPLSYQRMIEIHDEMRDAQPKHMSPFEHCGQTMNHQEYELSINGKLEWTGGQYDKPLPTEGSEGWSGNFRGFKQYRKMIENENITSDPRVIRK